MYQDEVLCKACEDASDPEKLRAEIVRLRKDSERLAYLYSGTKTGSNALIDIELRLLNGDAVTLDEARNAIDEAMKTPNK